MVLLALIQTKKLTIQFLWLVIGGLVKNPLFGTSIPAGSGSGYLSYPEYVGKTLNCTVDNQAVGSSGIIWNGTRALSLSATIAELTATFGAGYAAQSYQNKVIGKKVDLIVFDHGFNDRIKATGSDLGTIDSVDRTTFYGAFNYVIQAALADNPSVNNLCYST